MEAIDRYRHQADPALTQPTRLPTIFARSTGALPSAIAIVRVSGPDAGLAAERLCGSLPPPRRAVLRALRRPDDGAILDRALVLWMPGPATATGEDLLELHVHGGRAVVAAVEAALAALPGLVAASPGDFTRRAFENGRLDLTQVEGLGDLLTAETERQRTAALAVADGGLRSRVELWRSAALDLAARVEAALDFSDEGDVEEDPALATDARALAAVIRATLAEPPPERLRDGVRVAIAGPPNAGKSTLLNALVGRDVAITSAVAGTTRDVIETTVVIDGVPIVFFDTAGLRERPGDAIEAQGIARARGALERSDLILWLGDAEGRPPGNMMWITAKCDTISPDPRADVAVSALTGAGLDDLRRAIVARATALLPAAGAIVFGARHRVLLASAIDALERAAYHDDAILCAEELRQARDAFDAISGRANPEALLDTLFARFCIGK